MVVIRASEDKSGWGCGTQPVRSLDLCSFRFTGSTIVYAHLQAAGLVNDHLVGCFRYPELTKGR